MLPGKKLNKFVREITYEQLPARVKKYAKLCLLDTIACTIAGVHKGTVNRQLGNIKTTNPLQRVTLIGQQIKAPVLDAFHINAYACSRNDLDRGQHLQFMHPGRLLILSALATGEELNVSKKELLTAIVLGYEVITRVGRAVRSIGWLLDEACPDPAFSPICFTLPGITSIAMNLLGMNIADDAEIEVGSTDSENIIKQQNISSPSSNKPMLNNKVTLLLMKMFSLLRETSDRSITISCSSDYELINKVGAELKRSKELTARLGQKYLTIHVGLIPTSICNYLQSLIIAVRKITKEERIDIGKINRMDFIGLPWLAVAHGKHVKDIADRMATATALLVNNINPEAAWYLNGKLEHGSIQELAGKIKFFSNVKAIFDYIKTDTLSTRIIINTTYGLRKRVTIKHAFSEAQDVNTDYQFEARFNDFVPDVIGEKKARKFREEVLNNKNIMLCELIRLLQPEPRTFLKGLISAVKTRRHP